MSNIKERVAYLQGLTKGLNVNEQSAEGKILLNIIDVLDNMAEDFNNMHLAQLDLETYVETIDEDLTDLEEEVYEDGDGYTGDDDFVEVQCPVCHEPVTFETEVLEDDDALEVTCPHCGGVVYDNTLEFDNEIDAEIVGVNEPLRHTIHPGV